MKWSLKSIRRHTWKVVDYTVNEISLRFKEGVFFILSSFFFTGKKNQKPPTSKPRPAQIHPRGLCPPEFRPVEAVFDGLLRRVGRLPSGCGRIVALHLAGMFFWYFFSKLDFVKRIFSFPFEKESKREVLHVFMVF